MTGIDNIDTEFIIFVNVGGSSRWKIKVIVKYMMEENSSFGSRNNGIEFGFGGTESCN